MGSLGSPKTWIPYMNNKDCSQGFCSIYCRQWCYIIFSPPPPFEFPNENSSSNFSPLVVAIIGILASAFLLVSYYTIISKYCGNSTRQSSREDQNPNDEDHRLDQNQNHSSSSLHEPWSYNVASTNGLDENLIKSITVCKYKRGDGLIESTDCSVCLSEFEDNESIRLLPKCSHAFHLPCIDTWLKSHSNCPLCRSNIVSFNSFPIDQTPPPNHDSFPQNNQSHENENESTSHISERGVEADEVSPVRALSDLRSSVEGDTIIEIRDGGCLPIRRSFSMDHSCRDRVRISDVLRLDNDDDIVRAAESSGEVGSSKEVEGEGSKFGHKKERLHCVKSPVSMKRSFSSGRFLLSTRQRCQSLIPV